MYNCKEVTKVNKNRMTKLFFYVSFNKFACLTGLGICTFAQSLIAIFCSFGKSDCAIALTIDVYKRATKKAIAQSLFSKQQLCKKAKKGKCSKSYFFLSLKRTIAHFRNVRLPNPAVKIAANNKKSRQLTTLFYKNFRISSHN